MTLEPPDVDDEHLVVIEGATCEPVTASEVLPGIDHALVARFVAEKPMTRAVRAYLRALREPG